MAKKLSALPAVTTEQTAQPRQLFVTVNTYNSDGNNVGSRVVDMYHYGTRNWLQNHTWWAMHNSCTVETVVATDQEVKDYVATANLALADKFAKEPLIA